MSKTLQALFWTAIFCTGSIAPAYAQETGFSPTEREVRYLAKIWPGDYDNQEQISFDARANHEKEFDQARFHTVVKRINVPQLGKFVFYSEEHRDADIAKVHRKRVYTLSADETKKAIRIETYSLKKPTEFNSAYGVDEAPANITPNDLEKRNGCDYLLRRDGDSFAGSLAAKTCQQNDGSYLERRLRISRDMFSFQERRVDRTNNVVDSINGFAPRDMKRARWFACMVDVPKNTPNVANHTQHYIKIYDQGGRFDFVHPDGRDMFLLMRNTWSYGMQRETFFIGIFEPQEAAPKLLVYSWGQPGADRIGMNPGYVRIQCDVDSKENVRLQKALRVES